jgi:hypothetical protein|tara:strand:- start:202 stop:387 length:186 start_codon:yes stop_codon:yes gene_type:complete
MASKTNSIDIQMAQMANIDPDTFDLESWEPNQLEIEFEPDFEIEDDDGEFVYRLIIEDKPH